MRFTGCMVTNSICGPSRATILIGKYSHKNGFVDNTNGTKFDFSQLTFTKVLQQAGYKTAMIGKLHLGGTPTGFDYYSGRGEAASLNNMTISNTMTLERDLKMTDQPRRGLNEDQLELWNSIYGPISFPPISLGCFLP
jgi:arylsulfatase A-like enzyme